MPRLLKYDCSYEKKNVKCNFTTKHSSQFNEILCQARVDKIEHLKKSIKNSKVFLTSYRKYSELVTKLSSKLCESMAEKKKAFR